MLASFTRHRHLIHAGYVFSGNGSWILQDGTFSGSDLLDALREPDVQRVTRAYESSLSIHIHCPEEGIWRSDTLLKDPVFASSKVRMNPPDKEIEPNEVAAFKEYLSGFLGPASLEDLLNPSDVVGNIRFSRPTLYVFPGGQGDAAMFGINGFNILFDGGFSRRACCWNFVRHLDRLDAVLMSRLNNGNLMGMSAMLQRKVDNATYPQIGHFFTNLVDQKISRTASRTATPLLVNTQAEAQRLLTNLKGLALKPTPCLRDNSTEPINLYHKVGHGRLDLYVLNPQKDGAEMQAFLKSWTEGPDQSRVTLKVKGKEFPVANLVSICCLLVWIPDDRHDTVTRLLFPGSAPQQKVFEGLDRLKHLEFMKTPVCLVKSLGHKKYKTLDSLLKSGTRTSSVAGRTERIERVDAEQRRRVRSSSRHARNGDSDGSKKPDKTGSEMLAEIKAKKQEANKERAEKAPPAKPKPKPEKADVPKETKSAVPRPKKPKGPKDDNKQTEEASKETRDSATNLATEGKDVPTPVKVKKEVNNKMIVEEKKVSRIATKAKPAKTEAKVTKATVENKTQRVVTETKVTKTVEAKKGAEKGKARPDTKSEKSTGARSRTKAPPSPKKIRGIKAKGADGFKPSVTSSPKEKQGQEQEVSTMRGSGDIEEVTMAGDMLTVTKVTTEVQRFIEEVQEGSAVDSLEQVSGDFSREIETDSLELRKVDEKIDSLKQSPTTEDSKDIRQSSEEVLRRTDIEEAVLMQGGSASSQKSPPRPDEALMKLTELQGTTAQKKDAVKTPDEVAELPEHEALEPSEHEELRPRPGERTAHEVEEARKAEQAEAEPPLTGRKPVTEEDTEKEKESIAEDRSTSPKSEKDQLNMKMKSSSPDEPAGDAEEPTPPPDTGEARESPSQSPVLGGQVEAGEPSPKNSVTHRPDDIYTSPRRDIYPIGEPYMERGVEAEARHETVQRERPEMVTIASSATTPSPISPKDQRDKWASDAPHLPSVDERSVEEAAVSTTSAITELSTDKLEEPAEEGRKTSPVQTQDGTETAVSTTSAITELSTDKLEEPAEEGRKTSPVQAQDGIEAAVSTTSAIAELGTDKLKEPAEEGRKTSPVQAQDGIEAAVSTTSAIAELGTDKLKEPAEESDTSGKGTQARKTSYIIEEYQVISPRRQRYENVEEIVTYSPKTRSRQLSEASIVSSSEEPPSRRAEEEATARAKEQPAQKTNLSPDSARAEIEDTMLQIGSGVVAKSASYEQLAAAAGKLEKDADPKTETKRTEKDLDSLLDQMQSFDEPVLKTEDSMNGNAAASPLRGDSDGAVYQELMDAGGILSAFVPGVASRFEDGGAPGPAKHTDAAPEGAVAHKARQKLLQVKPRQNFRTRQADASKLTETKPAEETPEDKVLTATKTSGEAPDGTVRPSSDTPASVTGSVTSALQSIGHMISGAITSAAETLESREPDAIHYTSAVTPTTTDGVKDQAEKTSQLQVDGDLTSEGVGAQSLPSSAAEAASAAADGVCTSAARAQDSIQGPAVATAEAAGTAAEDARRAAETTAENALDRVSDATQAAASRTEAAAADIGTELRQARAAAEESAKGAASEMQETCQTTGDWTAKAVAGVESSVRSFGEALSSSLSEAVGAADRKAQDADKVVTERAADAARQTGEVAALTEDVCESAVKAAEEVVGRVKSAAEEKASDVGATAASVGEALSSSQRSAESTATSGLADLEDEVKATASTGQGFIEQSTTYIQDVGTALLSGASEAAERISAQAASMSDSMITTLADVVPKSGAHGSAGQAPGVTETRDETPKAEFHDVQKQAEPSAKITEDICTSAGKGVAEQAQTASESAHESLKLQAQDIISGVQTATKGVTEQAQTASESAHESLKLQGQDIMSGVQAATKGVTEQAQTASESAQESLKLQAQDVMSGVEAASKTADDVLRSGIRDAKEEIEAAIDAAGDDTRSTAQDTMEQVKVAAKAAEKAVSSDVADAGKQVETTFEAAKDVLAAEAHDVEKQAQTAAETAEEALATGIEDAKVKAETAAKAADKTMVKGAQDAEKQVEIAVKTSEKALMDGVKDAADQVEVPVKAAEEILSDAKDVLKRTEADVQSDAKALAATAQDVTGQLKEVTQVADDAFRTGAESAAGQIQTVIRSADEALSCGVQDAKVAVEETAQSASKILKEGVESADTTFETTTKVIDEAVMDKFQDVEDVQSQVASEAAKEASKISQEAQDAAKHVETSAKASGEALATGVSEVSRQIDSATKAVEQSLSKSATEAEKQAQEIDTLVSDAAHETVQQARESATGLQDSVSETLAKADAHLKSAMDKRLEEAEKSASQGVEKLSEFSSAADDQVNQAVQEVVRKADDSAQGVSEALSRVGRQSSDVMQDAEDAVQESAESVSSSVMSVVEGVSTGLSKVEGEMQSATQQLASDATEMSESLYQSAEETLEEVGSATRSTFGGLFGFGRRKSKEASPTKESPKTEKKTGFFSKMFGRKSPEQEQKAPADDTKIPSVEEPKAPPRVGPKIPPPPVVERPSPSEERREVVEELVVRRDVRSLPDDDARRRSSSELSDIREEASWSGRSSTREPSSPRVAAEPEAPVSADVEAPDAIPRRLGAVLDPMTSSMHESFHDVMTGSFHESLHGGDAELSLPGVEFRQPRSPPQSLSPSLGAGEREEEEPVPGWGPPLGLPSPVPPPDHGGVQTPPPTKRAIMARARASDSPRGGRLAGPPPVYLDLVYVPHHANSFYSSVQFFHRVRARYYVFSSIEPSREVFNALLEAKQHWEDKDLEVTIIPTYDTDTLGHWFASNEQQLEDLRIDLAPSASRCTINLQDHETSCAAYRLEF
ncbi:LOW QUALITY PROTEIN: microtubule-associated protein 1B-like [Pollicipes pollicipes]|uniref:LOW QUALITY PROTEIN: microtubule-associated protein 1B-like n=1 Tax=Pollicipes pollicipes TaxID=41117 RepID=UPI001884A1DB|nr:LOW QUALITY PROTEIN: microtubule-associated protein 1B-like [Pollicipes pollicipes]